MSLNKSGNQAIGVAVSDGEHSFVVHPTAEQDNLIWSSTYDVDVFNNPDQQLPIEYNQHLSGRDNTDVILNAVEVGWIEDAPAAQYCDGITFAHGAKGYLLSTEEVLLAFDNLTDINVCLNAIDGLEWDLINKDYWLSVEETESYAYNSLFFLSKTRASEKGDYRDKRQLLNVRAVSTL